MPFLCKKYKIDTLFSPNYTCPLFLPGIRSVVTIHDLSFFPLEKLYPLSRRLFKPIIHLSIRASDTVIAVSEFTKKDILRYIGPFEHKIKVIYEAADQRFNGPASQKLIDEIKSFIKYRGSIFYLQVFWNRGKILNDCFRHSQQYVKRSAIIWLFPEERDGGMIPLTRK